MRCKYCNTEIKEGELFCSNCGRKAEIDVQKEKTKKGISPLVLIIITIVALAAGFGIGYYINKIIDIKREDGTQCVDALKDKCECPLAEEDEDDWGIPKRIKHELDIDKIEYLIDGPYKNDIQLVKVLYYSEDNFVSYPLTLLFKNNSKDAISYTGYLNFLDKTNTRVDRTIDSGRVNPNKYFVVQLSNASSDEYENVSVTLETEKMKSYYKTVNLNIKDAKITKEDSSIRVEYKNNTKNKFTANFTIIYYKGNNIVSFDKAYMSEINPGSTENAKFYTHNIYGYEQGKDLKEVYDKYVIDIQDATIYDSTY